MIRLKFDRRVKIMTVIFSLIIIAIGTWVYIRSGGSFLPAWITILGAATLLLTIMSIPKGVVVTPNSVEIHCLVEMTSIKFGDITSVKILEKRSLNPCLPILGIFGFFGYFGFYYSFRLKRVFKIYTRSWRNMVLIERGHGRTFVISVENPNEFVRKISEHIK